MAIVGNLISDLAGLAARIVNLRVCGDYPNRNTLLRRRGHMLFGESIESWRRSKGYTPATCEYELSDGEQGIIRVREADIPLLCLNDRDAARRHLALILAAREGLKGAAASLDETLENYYRELTQKTLPEPCPEDSYVVPSTSKLPHEPIHVSDKGSTLLRLTQQGYPVPDFVILTSAAYLEWEQLKDELLHRVLSDLEALTCQKLSAPHDPLIFAIRVAMPQYAPGLMPTYLNVGVTEAAIPGLRENYGEAITNKIYLNTLRNLLQILDPSSFDEVRTILSPRLEPTLTARLVGHLRDLIAGIDKRLIEDPIYQTSFFLKRAFEHYESNMDLLLTLARGKVYRPAVVFQKMVCSMRDDMSYAGVLFSRHSWTGEGYQLQVGHNMFGEEIMTGTVEPEDTSFMERAEIKDRFPAIHHFLPRLRSLELEFQGPVTIEFATENTKDSQFFALLQVNHMEMSGRAAVVSVYNMHREGLIPARRVTELIRPYHIKQIEADAIDVSDLDELKEFSQGVAVLPRGAVTCRIYFESEAAFEAKRRGEKVCFCKKTFEPTDTVVMREMDGIISLTAAAIHVVTICQSYGVPALLSLEKFGITLAGDRLVNPAGKEIKAGDWVTISSYRHTLYEGKVRYRPARLIKYMRGEPVEFAPDEKRAFELMVEAYSFYRRLVAEMDARQIANLNELSQLVNLELRGKPEEARELVRGWFDNHEQAYVDQVLASEMGDHLNQHSVFDMLDLQRKVRFYKDALDRCRKRRIYGYTAGAFMLGRFISVTQPVAFWRSFEPWEVAMLVNEWLLFEKYMRVLNQVGERKVVRAKSVILQDGLGTVPLSPPALKCLIPIKLARIQLDAVRAVLPKWRDPQVFEVLDILERPFKDFYDYDSPWSIEELRRICEGEGLPIPDPNDA